ncbi:MAG: CarD family transcriptional regulator [Erysipelotrichales bacterium]|nr:CarD family transcriptional regulator [Erysipelotrichales bacterium]MBQ2310222.1 CarD family transcriptional regulator [Erysipelotrichales bacterium]MBQ4375759.1 CarD family transcriptional regulator [Erysipelotrichales bacterium]MBQ5542310.1 CarD family transcriptional regulator [Erysipelotrichales bacterium]
MHRYNGLCKISGMKKMAFKGPAVHYYVLEPVYDSASTIYVPKEKAAELLRTPLPKDEILKLIDGMAGMPVVWVDDMKRRKDAFTDIIHRGDPVELVSMIQSIYKKAKERNAIGKRLSEADQRQLTIAEKVISGEFAYGLSEEPPQILERIRLQLK